MKKTTTSMLAKLSEEKDIQREGEKTVKGGGKKGLEHAVTKRKISLSLHRSYHFFFFFLNLLSSFSISWLEDPQQTPHTHTFLTHLLPLMSMYDSPQYSSSSDSRSHPLLENRWHFSNFLLSCMQAGAFTAFRSTSF